MISAGDDAERPRVTKRLRPSREEDAIFKPVQLLDERNFDVFPKCGERFENESK
jgi:hypothetical protein